MELKRVVVTGIGVITPLGNSVEELFTNFENGVSGSELITSFDTSKFKTKFACQVKGFDPHDYLDKKEAKKLDPYAQYAMGVAEKVIADSHIELDKVNLNRFGVVWGSGIGGLETFLREIVPYAQGDGTPRFSPFFIPKLISNIAAGHISIRYGLKGLSYTTTSACASSSHAIIDAFNYIKLGKADIIMTGGSEAVVNEAGVGGFNALHAISTNNENYKTASRPFDHTRDGFVMGDGAVALILEDFDHAKSRGAKIYAEMIGGGMSSDAYHLTAPHPEGEGAVRVMREAVNDAGIKLEQVDYINVHGTSTPLGDIAELKGIVTLFGEHAYNLNISSTKSMTGHLLGAAGALESVAAIMAITKKVVPPTINFSTPDPEIDQRLNLTLLTAQKRDVKIAMSNTFGFGGHNASVIFKEYSE